MLRFFISPASTLTSLGFLSVGLPCVQRLVVTFVHYYKLNSIELKSTPRSVTILSVPFCLIPFCLYKILSILNLLYVSLSVPFCLIPFCLCKILSILNLLYVSLSVQWRIQEFRKGGARKGN